MRYEKDGATGGVRDTQEDEVFSIDDIVECLNRQDRTITRLYAKILKMTEDSGNN